jgi:hypothetical protein
VTLIFNHIPKTAGASFRYILREQYKNSIFEISDTNLSRDLQNFKNLSNESQQSYDIISGHCSQFLESIFNEVERIVFLREPVNQLLSTFYQIRKNPKNKWHDVSMKCRNIFDVVDFLDQYGLTNLQTRFLASNNDLVKGLETKQNHFKKIDKEDLFLAIQNFKKYSHIGITEEFDKSILIFKKKLNWKTPYYIHGNRTKEVERIEFSNEDFNKIKEIQIYDYKLYEAALKQFREFEKETPVSDKEIRVFQVKNLVFNKIKRFI